MKRTGSYNKLKLQMLMRSLLIVGGLIHLGLGLGLVSVKGISKVWWLSFIIGVCAVSFAFDRDFYLPFLGPTVSPYIEATHHLALGNLVNVQLKGISPNSTVIFWAAQDSQTAKEDDGSDPMKAYGDYSNAGVAKSDADGNVLLKLKCPMEYNVRSKRLPKHVHWRVEDPNIKGLFGKVNTTVMNC